MELSKDARESGEEAGNGLGRERRLRSCGGSRGGGVRAGGEGGDRRKLTSSRGLREELLDLVLDTDTTLQSSLIVFVAAKVAVDVQGLGFDDIR